MFHHANAAALGLIWPLAILRFGFAHDLIGASSLRWGRQSPAFVYSQHFHRCACGVLESMFELSSLMAQARLMSYIRALSQCRDDGAWAFALRLAPLFILQFNPFCLVKYGVWWWWSISIRHHNFHISCSDHFDFNGSLQFYCSALIALCFDVY